MILCLILCSSIRFLCLKFIPEIASIKDDKVCSFSNDTVNIVACERLNWCEDAAPLFLCMVCVKEILACYHQYNMQHMQGGLAGRPVQEHCALPDRQNKEWQGLFYYLKLIQFKLELVWKRNQVSLEFLMQKICYFQISWHAKRKKYSK